MSDGIEHFPAELSDHDRGLFLNLSNSQRIIVDRRLWIIGQWDAARIVGRAAGLRESETVKSFIARMASISPPLVGARTLFAWRKAYKEHGIVGLFDLRWGILSDAETRRRICEWANRLTGPGLRDMARVAVYLLNVEAARCGKKLTRIPGLISTGFRGDRRAN